jgi:hypothetical protein
MTSLRQRLLRGAPCQRKGHKKHCEKLMPQLDINQALAFLDMLDPGGRHTLASEAPFGGFGGTPKWEIGGTFEPSQRWLLIEEIQKRQARGSNVYYSVNRPCAVWHQQGYNGKCTAEDIIAIRAIAFDVDFEVKNDQKLVQRLLEFVDMQLIGALRPSLVINTGGGFQLIYLLKDVIDVQANPDQRRAVTDLAKDFESLLRAKVPSSLPVKIDNMSNVDRVMRLPGTVNFPKAEKRAKGQVAALAHIVVDYHAKCDAHALRAIVPVVHVASPIQPKCPYIPRPNDPWTAYAKAQFCCEWVRDCGIADTNASYSHNVLFPLLGEVRDGNLTLEEGEELFLEAVSGGPRYGTAGRGLAYFKRQWRSHLHASRNGGKHLGSLIDVCKKLGMPIPWKNRVVWEDSYETQLAAIQKLNQSIDSETFELLKNIK